MWCISYVVQHGCDVRQLHLFAAVQREYDIDEPGPDQEIRCHRGWRRRAVAQRAGPELRAYSALLAGTVEHLNAEQQQHQPEEFSAVGTTVDRELNPDAVDPRVVDRASHLRDVANATLHRARLARDRGYGQLKISVDAAPNRARVISAGSRQNERPMML